MTSFYNDIVLKEYLPDKARNTILRILRNNNIYDERIDILNNLEQILKASIESSRGPTGDFVGYHPHVYRKIVSEFEFSLKEMLLDIGNLIDISTYLSGISKYHDDAFMAIYENCRSHDLTCEIGCCDGFIVDNNGNSDHANIPLLRISDENSLFEFTKISDEQLHVSRFIYPEGNTFQKIQWFKKILKILFRNISVVSGSAATCNDQSVKMGSDGNWRFESIPTVFGFNVNRLYQFWLRCGGLPMRLFGKNANLIYFLREEAAIRALQQYNDESPKKVSPLHYASPFGIYSKDFLSTIR